MKKPMGAQSDPLKLLAIKTKNNVLVSDNVKGESYFHTKIKGLLFDGKKVESTYHKDWFKLNTIPSKIEKQVPQQQINRRYELREGFQETELTPKLIKASYIDEDSEYYEVKGLYELKYELTEPTFEEIDFEINIIEELDREFEIVKQDYDFKYNLLDKIQTHPVLLQEKPCELSKEDTYKIIRNHVKANINPKYAKVTSDYDFCFTVEKLIELYQVHSYEVNINAMTKRKPKYEKRYQRNRSVKIYEAAPKPYQSYPVVTPFSGKNAKDLKANIAKFLDELMEKINEPLIECSHCKGNGVILDEN